MLYVKFATVILLTSIIVGLILRTYYGRKIAELERRMQNLVPMDALLDLPAEEEQEEETDEDDEEEEEDDE